MSVYSMFFSAHDVEGVAAVLRRLVRTLDVPCLMLHVD
jgi:hypothetical protein